MKAGYIIISLIIISYNVFAQLGTPYIQSYSPNVYYAEEYISSPQNFSLVQDNRGVIYVTNASGILEYDGAKWRKIPKTEHVDHTVVKDNSGLIYVAGDGDLGYLEPDSLGNMQFVSLLSYLNEKDQNIGTIWGICTTNNAVYFQSRRKLFRWKNNELKVWETEKLFRWPYVVFNNFYISHTDGLMQIRNDSLLLAPGGETFKDKDIKVMLPYETSNKILIISENEAFVYDEDSIIPYPTHSSHIFAKHQIFNGIKLSNSDYAFGSLANGILITDPKLNFKQHLAKEEGLQNDVVINMYTDRQNGIWLTHDVGLSRAEYPAPLSYFGEKSGIQGIVLSILRHEGILYVATTTGVYYSKKSNGIDDKLIFDRIDEITNLTFQLLLFNNTILTAGSHGIYQIENLKPTLISNINAYSLHQSKQDSTRIFYGQRDGIASLQYKHGKWIQEPSLKGIDYQIKSIVEPYPGHLWLSTYDQGIYKLEFPEGYSQNPVINQYNTNDGLPEIAYPYLIKGELLFGTTAGIFRFDGQNETFYRDISWGIYFKDPDNDAIPIEEDANGNIWAVSQNTKAGIIKTDSLGNRYWDPTPSLRIPKADIWTIYSEPDGIIWFGTNDGLVRYDQNINKDYTLDFPALIRKVTLGEDSVIFWGTYYDENALASLTQPEILKPVLDYMHNWLTFEFAAPSFDNESANQFRYFLVGFDKQWSEWSAKTEKEYTNVPEGKYIFRVQAKNIYGHISQEGRYELTILSPWYRTYWAYAGYFLFFIGFVYGSIKVSTRGLKIIIDKQTAEIRLQKELIEEKNKDITDSINYARRIQKAILPLDEEIKVPFPESFVLFKPKDIVSGDFYYFNKSNGSIIFAAVDCTGHGVPGAFMSMMGNDLLNQIVKENKITMPSDILNNLHKGIRSSLKQYKEDAEISDGMDIALCCYEPKENHLQYAGAHNSLFIVNKDEPDQIKEIKADKIGIGGVVLGEKRDFTNHEISLRQGDTIYLFSDGYQDQFGGPRNKKYSSRRFKEFLSRIHDLDMPGQKKALENEIEEWKGNNVQIDDILVMGIRV